MPARSPAEAAWVAQHANDYVLMGLPPGQLLKVSQAAAMEDMACKGASERVEDPAIRDNYWQEALLLGAQALREGRLPSFERG